MDNEYGGDDLAQRERLARHFSEIDKRLAQLTSAVIDLAQSVKQQVPDEKEQLRLQRHIRTLQLPI